MNVKQLRQYIRQGMLLCVPSCMFLRKAEDKYYSDYTNRETINLTPYEAYAKGLEDVVRINPGEAMLVLDWSGRTPGMKFWEDQTGATFSVQVLYETQILYLDMNDR